MIYADTSALAKLIAPERESPGLVSWLSSERSPGRELSTNRIGAIELQRFAARLGGEMSAAALALLARLDLLEISTSAYTLAAVLPPTTLRTLDALHVASAVSVSGVVAFLTYDHRMFEAARAAGLPVVSPA